MSLFQSSSNARNSVLFDDRTEAGEQLAQAVLQEAKLTDAPFVVYALPRGGVPVAVPIARALQCPLDIIVAKKIVRPQNPELAIGAVTADGHVLRASNVPVPEWQTVLEQAQTKAIAQLSQFSDRPAVSVEGAIAVLVDDGIATGMTIAVAAKALREQRPREIWICAPVAPAILVNNLRQYCDRLIVLATPDPFWSVSRFYRSFPQVELDAAISGLKNSLQSE